MNIETRKDMILFAAILPVGLIVDQLEERLVNYKLAVAMEDPKEEIDQKLEAVAFMCTMLLTKKATGGTEEGGLELFAKFKKFKENIDDV